MSAERPQKKINPVVNYLVNSETANRVLEPLIREVIIKSGVELFDFRDPSNYLEEFYSMGQGKRKMILSNHQSLADVGAVIDLSRRLNRFGNGDVDIDLVVSGSLNEKQGSYVKKFYNAAKPILAKNRITTYEVARYKDRMELGMEATDEVNQALHDTAYGDDTLFVFLEGVQTGGRLDSSSGNINGMVKIMNNQASDQINTSIFDVGRDVAILPIGVHGGYRIVNPSAGRLTFEAMKKIGVQKVPMTQPKMADIFVGMPFTATDIWESGVDLMDNGMVNDFIGRRIAQNLPEEARGFYA